MRCIELFCDDLEPLYVLGDFDSKSISHVQAEVSSCTIAAATSATAKTEVNVVRHHVGVNTLGCYKGGRDETMCST